LLKRRARGFGFAPFFICEQFIGFQQACTSLKENLRLYLSLRMWYWNTVTERPHDKIIFILIVFEGREQADGY